MKRLHEEGYFLLGYYKEKPVLNPALEGKIPEGFKLIVIKPGSSSGKGDGIAPSLLLPDCVSNLD